MESSIKKMAEKNMRLIEEINQQNEAAAAKRKQQHNGQITEEEQRQQEERDAAASKALERQYEIGQRNRAAVEKMLAEAETAKEERQNTKIRRLYCQLKAIRKLHAQNAAIKKIQKKEEKAKQQQMQRQFKQQKQLQKDKTRKVLISHQKQTKPIIKPEKGHGKSLYPVRYLTHDAEQKIDKPIGKLYKAPQTHEASDVSTPDVDEDALKWKANTSKETTTIEKDTFEKVMHDIKQNLDKLIVLCVVTDDMDTIIIMQQTEQFFQFLEQIDFEVSISYIYAIYRNETKYYMAKPNDLIIRNLMIEIRNMFLAHSLVTGEMLCEIQNMGIFKNLYIA